MNTRKVIILSAPSGSGKSTLVRHLLDRGLPLAFSISATSRSPRGEEQHGRDYYFLSPDEFRRRAAAGHFLEWEEVYDGCYYGTPRDEVDRLWATGHAPLFDVDVVGGTRLKEIFGPRALSIFIQAPSIDTLRERLTLRATDSPEAIERRLAKAHHEMQHAPRFDVTIINDNLADACRDIERVVTDFLLEP